MLAYSYDENKYYAGKQECQLDPLETEKVGHYVWLLPADCTLAEPLEEKEGYKVKWNGEEWEYEEIPIKEEEKPHELTEAEKKELQIMKLKLELASTDYKTLKWVDGALTDEEYAEVRAYRAELRAKINELEG